jgi:hypothetical protein
MAGGVNPFGFSGGVIPQAVRPPKRGPQDLPSAPFGFAPPPSKMQQTLAILNEYNPLPAFERLLKSPMALGGPISEQDIADGLMVSGAVTGGSAAAPKPRNALNMGIRAYHGSPHDFDEFSMSKIGTGEGAQAYGHGLYFAEAEDTARVYKDALKNKALIDPNADMLDPKRIAGELYDSWQGDIAGALDDAKSYDNSRAIIAELNKIKANPPAGRMYEVEINADPDAFLDWDKPLSEQPEAAKTALDAELRRYLGGSYEGQMPNFEGRSAGEILGQTDRNIVRQADTLREAGIPGIKYLDAGSRGAGDGTRNYVVFDEKLISIVKKYGIAGASAMLGYNILEGMDPAQAEELQRIEGNQ